MTTLPKDTIGAPGDLWISTITDAITDPRMELDHWRVLAAMNAYSGEIGLAQVSAVAYTLGLTVWRVTKAIGQLVMWGYLGSHTVPPSLQQLQEIAAQAGGDEAPASGVMAWLLPHKALTSNEKLVAWQLHQWRALNALPDGWARLIGESLGVGEKTARRAVRRLLALGIVRAKAGYPESLVLVQPTEV